MHDDQIAPPAQLHTLMEGRAGLELTQLMWALPMLRMRVPKGAGHVLVLPGFMNDDTITWPLRHFLTSLGYTPHPWELGVSRKPMFSYLPRLIERAERIGGGKPITLLGYSRGGALAREIARERPDLIRGVVTVASPVRGGPQATSIGAFAARQTGMSPELMRRLQRERALVPIRVPIVALYSKTDGIVSWRACLDEETPGVRHVEVRGSHAGMMFNTGVYRHVAEALSAIQNHDRDMS